ncbi:hypothetical protein RUM43_009830 [Polyplax serrata]|uniref:Uncharacterized protein n=1 Tax=Polyplax serrata TaxID=468196 RepID=A0AAN8RZX4_POLSC
MDSDEHKILIHSGRRTITSDATPIDVSQTLFRNRGKENSYGSNGEMALVNLSVDEIESFLWEMPVNNLDAMISLLEEILRQLEEKLNFLNDMENKLKQSDEDIAEAVYQLETIRVRIIWLIDQAKIGLERVTTARGTRSRQGTEAEKFAFLMADLEKWLEEERDILRQEPTNDQEIILLIRAFEVSDTVERVHQRHLALESCRVIHKFHATLLSVEALFRLLEDKNFLKELRLKSQALEPISIRLVEFEKDPDLHLLHSSLKPRLEALQRDFDNLENLIRDRVNSLQVRVEWPVFKSLAPGFWALPITHGILG